MKRLFEDYPADGVEWLAYGPARVEVLAAALPTVTPATDKVVGAGRGRNRWLLLVEMLASYKAHIPERTHFHSTLLLHKHKLPVRSVIVLLRHEADGPAMTGAFELSCPNEDPYLSFQYHVIRLWNVPASELLKSG